MKSFAVTVLFLIMLSTKNFAQSNSTPADAEKVLVDNDKMKVTEYTSIPGGSVCGKGIHHHGAHFTVILTDAAVEITLHDGKKIVQQVPAGTSFWSEPETHAIKNMGNTAVKVQIIETKS